MAKTHGPLMSFGARGQLGKSLMFSGWKGLKTVKKFSSPSNPNTVGQQTQRSIVSQNMTAWNDSDFNIEDLAAFGLLSKLSKNKITGYNAFLRDAINIQKAGGSPYPAHGFGAGSPVPPGSSWSEDYTQGYMHGSKDVCCAGNGIVLMAVDELGYFYRSTDNGDSFARLATANMMGYFTKFSVAPNGDIYASANGMWVNAKSIDHGVVFSPMTGYLSWTNSNGCLALSNGSVLFHGGGIDGLFLSTDGGIIWIPKISARGASTQARLVELSGGRVLAVFNDSGKVYVSTDYGVSWNDPSAIATVTSILDIASSPDGTVYLITSDSTCFYKSTDGGASFTRNGQNFLTDLPNAVFAPVNGDIFLGCVTNKIVWRSLNAGSSFSKIDVPGFDFNSGPFCVSTDGRYISVGGSYASRFFSFGVASGPSVFCGPGDIDLDVAYGTAPRFLSGRIQCTWDSPSGKYLFSTSILTPGVSYYLQFMKRTGGNNVVSGIYRYIV